jgi:hypothetical protein
MLWHDYRARDAEFASRPGHALAHVAGACGDDALLQLFLRRLEERVKSSSQLERPDRLEVLQLQMDLAGVLRCIEADKRCADDLPGQPFTCLPDCLERDQNGTAVPAPASRAFA